MIEILPTCVPANGGDVKGCAEAIRQFAPSLHLDIDDGIFTHALTWPYERPGVWSGIAAPVSPDIGIEAHLMVQEGGEIGCAFARAGARRIVGHLEGFADAATALEALGAWREAGAGEAGLALLLSTPLDAVAPLVAACDVLHLMTIAEVGTQGIPYDPRAASRVRDARARFPDALISVDGGVSLGNIGDLARAGARRFGVGSAIFGSPDPAKAYAELLSAAESAIQ